jgi:hypothetical protein
MFIKTHQDVDNRSQTRGKAFKTANDAAIAGFVK